MTIMVSSKRFQARGEKCCTYDDCCFGYISWHIIDDWFLALNLLFFFMDRPTQEGIELQTCIHLLLCQSQKSSAKRVCPFPCLLHLRQRESRLLILCLDIPNVLLYLSPVYKILCTIFCMSLRIIFCLTPRQILTISASIAT